MLSICTFDVICAMSNSSTMLDVDMTILDTARLHDMNTNLTQHRKITKIRQKTRHRYMNMSKLYELKGKYVNFYITLKHNMT